MVNNNERGRGGEVPLPTSPRGRTRNGGSLRLSESDIPAP